MSSLPVSCVDVVSPTVSVLIMTYETRQNGRWDKQRTKTWTEIKLRDKSQTFKVKRRPIAEFPPVSISKLIACTYVRTVLDLD